MRKKSSTLSLFLGLVVALNLLGAAAARTQANLAGRKSYQFSNGRWFNGESFVRRTFYSVDGLLTLRKPARVDETLDLKNGFVIPPFADAHTHNLDGLRNLDNLARAYVEEGTFYVQVLGNRVTGAEQARPLLNKPTTLDVSYANGMLTATYGHPFMVYEPLAMGIYDVADAYRRVPEIKKSRLAENNAYWFIDSRADVDAKWDRIIGSKPDLIKIGLLDAENYDKHVLAGNTLDKGLSPEVAEYVVRRAHEAGLRVYAHVETAGDFRIGLRIGVDGFAHAPNYNWDGRLETEPRDDLTAADLKLAAEKNVVVIPTAARGVYRQTDYDANGKGTLDRERFGRVVGRYRRLYNEMRRRGVRLAFGLDNFGTTLIPEIWYFHDNKIFDNLALLKIAVETTSRTIFPNRKIGLLREGYEANFLVLGGNPLGDFNRIKNIEVRFKQGEFIKVGEEKT